MATRYLRKAAVADRYSVTTRSIERWVEEGRIPRPQYPTGRLPLWDEEQLEASDRATVLRHLKGTPATKQEIVA
jgi:predicted site-specific integrase-resolvase